MFGNCMVLMLVMTSRGSGLWRKTRRALIDAVSKRNGFILIVLLVLVLVLLVE